MHACVSGSPQGLCAITPLCRWGGDKSPAPRVPDSPRVPSSRQEDARGLFSTEKLFIP